MRIRRVPAVTHRFSRRRFSAALAGAGATLLAPPALRAQQPAAPSKPSAPTLRLKVGVLLPRSGLQGFMGQSCQKGAELAPGVLRELLGVEIELLNADTESNVDTARTRAERLIQQGAQVLVGAFDSGQTAAIAQVAEQRGVPLIVN